MSVWLVAIALLLEAVAVVAALAALALERVAWLPAHLQTVAACILLGGLGGCTYCLRGVYLNASVRESWNTKWLPWYLIRPVVSAILGGVTYLFVTSGLLLFGASQKPDASQLGIWAVAFLAGLNVDGIVGKLEAIGQSALGLTPSRQSRESAAAKDTGGKAE